MLQYSSASIATYLSAISYLHRMNKITDPTSNNLVQKTLAAIQKRNKLPDSRSPITIQILEKISQAVEKTVSSPYLKHLLRAMYLTAFFGFFRVGEITVSKNQNHTLNVSNLKLTKQNANLSLTSFKHTIAKGPLHRLPLKVRTIR